jgi:membrane-associated PAP2 superfamily phosphatase
MKIARHTASCVSTNRHDGWYLRVKKHTPPNIYSCSNSFVAMTTRHGIQLTFILLLWLAGIATLHHGLALDDLMEGWFFTSPCTRTDVRACWVISKSNATLTFWLHTVPRTVAFGIAAVALMVAVMSVWIVRFRPHAKACIVLVVGLGLTAGIVALLKQVTGHYCPAQLVRYGGVVADLALAHPAPRCFPAGHPAAGWGFLPLAFAPVAKGWRRLGLYLGIGCGVALSAVQMMRGEHFFSHVLATLLTAVCIGMVIRTLCSLPHKDV